MHRESYDLIGAEFGWGAQNHDAQKGPHALKAFGIEKYLHQQNPHVTWRTTLCAQIPYESDMKLNYPERLQQVHDFDQRLANEVKATLAEQHCPLVIGGDHAMAVGTWSGVVAALDAYQHFGLIWVDAHMDSHTPQTTPSQAIHGMPLAALLGYGESALTHLAGMAPKLSPRHVVLIGVRSFEEGEAALLKHLNVTIYFMEDIKKLGIKTVFERALKQVTQGTKGFGISIDLDGFDPSIAPGTGTPVADGLVYEEFAESLNVLSRHPLFCALEIAELNPVKDIDNKTLMLTQKLLACVVSHE
jgi:arginase